MGRARCVVKGKSHGSELRNYNRKSELVEKLVNIYKIKIKTKQVKICSSCRTTILRTSTENSSTEGENDTDDKNVDANSEPENESSVDSDYTESPKKKVKPDPENVEVSFPSFHN
jgi:hypothetical protein